MKTGTAEAEGLGAAPAGVRLGEATRPPWPAASASGGPLPSAFGPSSLSGVGQLCRCGSEASGQCLGYRARPAATSETAAGTAAGKQKELDHDEGVEEREEGAKDAARRRGGRKVCVSLRRSARRVSTYRLLCKNPSY